MIKLTHSINDREVWLNASLIQEFSVIGKSKTMQETQIILSNGVVYLVLETPEQILQKIQDEKFYGVSK